MELAEVTDFVSEVALVRAALEEPLRRIAENSGLDGGEVIAEVLDRKGNVVERYTYDLAGTPRFFNAAGQEVATSPSHNRFLFTGSGRNVHERFCEFE